MDAKWVKNVYGRNYSKPIATELKKQGFSPPNGGEFTEKIIQDIVHQRTKNIELSTAVLNIVKNAEKLKEQLQNSNNGNSELKQP